MLVGNLLNSRVWITMNSPATPLHRRRWFRISVNALLAVVCLWGATQEVELDRLLMSLSGASWPILIAVGAVTVVANLFKCLKLGLLLRREARLPFRTLFGAETVSILADVVFPFRLLEVIKAFVIARTSPVPMATVLGAEIVEKAVEFSVLLGLTVLTAFLAPLPDWLIPARWMGLVLLIGAVLFIGVGRHYLAAGSDEAVGATSFGRRIRRLAGQLFHGVRTASVSGSVLLMVLALTALEWATMAAGVWLAGASLGLSLTLLTVVGFLVANALSFAFPASSGGSVGIYELVGVKTLVLVASMDSVDALALVLAMHLVLLVFGALSGIIGLQLVGLKLFQLGRISRTRE